MVSKALRRRALPALGVLLMVSLSASSALADPSPADKETARGLMSQGEAQRGKNDLKGALQSFQAAHDLMHVPSTGLEVARTQAALGLLLEARETALQVTRIPATPNEPPPFVEARSKAQALSDELESRIPSIVVTVKNAPEGAPANITVDGAAIPAAALTLPRKLNPGHHTVAARAGALEGHSDVELHERELKTPVTLELAAPVATAPEPAPPAPVEPPPATASKSHTLTFVGFGVGGAGLVVGAITGLMSLSKTSGLKDQCPSNKCPPAAYDSQAFQDDMSSAKTLGTVSTVAFIVGGVGVAVGVASLFIKGTPTSASATAHASVTPWIGAGAAGIAGRF